MEQKLIIPYEWQGLDFSPTWEDEETGRKMWGTRRYRIFIWGHDQFNEPVCWVIDDYLPHCYVKVEVALENEDEVMPYILDAFNSNLKEYIREHVNNPNKSYLKTLQRQERIIVGYQKDVKRPLFYYNNKKDVVYKVYFELEASLSLCYEYLSRRKIKMGDGLTISAAAYNNGQSDRIPTEEKLIVEMKLGRSSWIYAQAMLVEGDGLTTLEKEYKVSYRQLQMIPNEYALKLGYPKPSSISFDSETFSAVFTRFPKPSRLEDEMYAVGFRHRVYGSLTDKKPKIHNYIFVIWDVAKYGPLKDYSDVYGPMTYIYCINEMELYGQLFIYIVRLDPTWIITYNGLGFDWNYVEERCGLHAIKVPNLSRIRGWFKSQFVRKTWKKYSSAWPQYPGRLDVDILYLVRIQFKFNSYKLKNVAASLMPGGAQKIELPYREQFRIFASKDKDGMNKIMDYLLSDILVPNELYDKLSIPIYLHTNGTVMRVNILSLYTEGQSTRCVNQLYCSAVEEEIYVNSRTIQKLGKYIGGLVFDQVPGVFEDVITFDWNSLYPSEMKVNNICFTTLINEEEEKLKADDDPTKIRDVQCHIVEGEVPIVDKKTKEIISMDHHRFRYIHKKTYVGLLPKIVTKLNALRNDYKKEMGDAYGKSKEFKKELDTLKKGWAENPPATDEEKEERRIKTAELAEKVQFWQTEGDIWNVKQMAVKVSANSQYGFMGMKSGKYSFVEGGMSTTIAGRNALKKTLEIITTKFGAKLVYGDSVTGATPLMLRLNGHHIHFMSIEELFNIPGILEVSNSGKEYKTLDSKSLVEVWTEKGWTKIQNIMRHKTTKPIYRVLTNTGYVEVTEDHSLLYESGKEITPREIKVGDKLLQSYPDEKLPLLISSMKDGAEFEFKDQVSCAAKCYFLKTQGIDVNLDIRNDQQNVFKVTIRKLQTEPNTIKKIELLTMREEEMYVYDLTTENHHFQAGIGNIIVHNTDSVMVQFPKEFINIGNYKVKSKEIAAYISSQFEEGMTIVPENYFPRYFTVTKKRYAAIKAHPEHPERLPTEEEIFNDRLYYPKGLITVRGNSCDIVYANFDPFMVKMLLKIPVQTLFDFIHNVALKIMRRDYPLDAYTFVQKLGANYKNTSSEMAVFADRLKQQGRSHKPGEELEYLYARTFGDYNKGDKVLKGYKMQAPDLFMENDGVLDTMYYLTNKLAKPLEQLLTSVYDDSVLKNYEKKIIRPRKPTVVQNVTKHWHLELYIRNYVAFIHKTWGRVTDNIKFIAAIAEFNKFLDYFVTDEDVTRKMKEKYNKDWQPVHDPQKAEEAVLKTPIHRYAVWGTD